MSLLQQRLNFFSKQNVVSFPACAQLPSCGLVQDVCFNVNCPLYCIPLCSGCSAAHSHQHALLDLNNFLDTCSEIFAQMCPNYWKSNSSEQAKSETLYRNIIQEFEASMEEVQSIINQCKRLQEGISRQMDEFRSSYEKIQKLEFLLDQFPSKIYQSPTV